VFVDADNFSAVDFGLSAASRDELYQAGRYAAKDFLAGWDFAEYLRTYRPSP
jgi:NTE family protein